MEIVKDDEIKVVIEIKGGSLVGVYSNQKLQYCLVDKDVQDQGHNPVQGVLFPDIVTDNLAGVFMSEFNSEKEVYDELKVLKF